MPRVLLIDDDKTFLDKMRQILDFEGFCVLVATTAADGISLAQEHRPNVVISDFVLPGSSGHEVAFALRHDPITQDIPIILLSGWQPESPRETAEHTGVSQYLMKPIAAHVLLDHIRRLMAEANSED